MLAQADSFYFGTLAERWRSVLGRPDWLTDLSSIAYLAFHALPVVVAVALHRARREKELDSFATTIVLTFLISYAGYFVWPATGPRVAPELEDAVLGGGAISSTTRSFLDAVEHNRLDAFPSGHVAVAVATFIHGGVDFPRARPALAFVVAGIGFSTVYLSLHYVVDVVAGVLLGVATPLGIFWLERRSKTTGVRRTTDGEPRT